MVIDTNTVLRYLLRDNPAQFKNATNVFESGENIILTDMVIAEALYVMRGESYKKDRTQVSSALRILLQKSGVISASGLANKYLKLYENSSLDLVDCYLIVYALKNKEDLETFDKKMRKVYALEKSKLN